MDGDRPPASLVLHISDNMQLINGGLENQGAFQFALNAA